MKKATQILRSIVVTGLLLSASVTLAEQTVKPNIILMVADDLGWNDVGFHGSSISTPSLDQLAQDGIELNRFYTNPVCTPARAALLTGRDPVNFGLHHSVIPPWSNVGLPLDEHLLGESFQAAGYQTGMIGKWHLGHSNRAQTPNARGFDYFYGNLTSGPGYFDHQARVGGLDWQRNGKSVVEEGYGTDLVAADAVRYIENRDSSRPFLLYIPWNAPHTPLQAPKKLIAKNITELNPARVIFAAMTESMDQGIGRILDTVRAQGIANNTIIVFFSDNGAMAAVGGRNTPLRGGKGTTFEGAIRVPAIIYWPSQLQGGVVNQTVFNVYDLFPTLAAIAGIDIVGDKPLDGINLLPQLKGEAQAPRNPMFFAADSLTPNAVRYAVIDWPWKLVMERTVLETSVDIRLALFNLEDDPNETTDLGSQLPGRVEELRELINDWRSRAPEHELHFHHFPHPGWAPPSDWNAALLNPEQIDLGYSKDKRTSQSVQIQLRQKAMQWFGERTWPEKNSDNIDVSGDEHDE